MSYSLDYLLKSTNLNELFPELSNFELPEINNVWEDWKNSKIVQLIDNGFEYLDLDKKEVFDKLFPGVFGTKDELSLSENPQSTTLCELSEFQSKPIPQRGEDDSLNFETEKSTIGSQSISSPSIEIITLEDNHNNKLNFTSFDTTQYMSPVGEQNNINLSQQEYKPNFQLQPVMASTVAAIHRTFSSVYTTAISSAQNAWQNHSNLTPANFSNMTTLQSAGNIQNVNNSNSLNAEENKSAPWSTLVKKFTSFVSPGYTLGRDSAAYFQLKLPTVEEFTEIWKSDTKLRRIFVNRACANYGNSSKAREVGDGDCGYVLDCWVSFADDPNGNKIRNCCSACALHWEKKGRSKKFPENNEKFVLIEASHEHVFEPDGTHLIKLRSNCSSSCPNVKGRKLELRFSLFDLSAKRELFSVPVSIRITRSGKSFENPLVVEF